MIVDLVKYFAKYPAKAGVLSLFDKNVLTGTLATEYANLKQFITTLPTISLVPELESFAFGMDESAIERAISNTAGFFLLLEYGPIRGAAAERTGRRDGDWKLALTVAHHFNVADSDPFTEAIIMDKCFGYLQTIVTQIEVDEYPACPLKRFSESAMHFTPVNPSELYESVGWMMDFSETIQAVV